MYIGKGIGATDTGRVRAGNEDTFLAVDDLGLFLVSDGMGGHAAGEVASTMTAQTVEAEVRQALPWLEELRRKGRLDRDDREAALTLLEEAVSAACHAVYQQSRFRQECNGMGCTLTVLLLVGDRGFVAHVGDSRLYLHRGGRTNRLTQDHRVIDELLRAGRITPQRAEELNLGNALSRAVGVQAVVQSDVLDMEVMSGDRFLLCSDGLHELMTEDDLGQGLASHGLSVLPQLFVDVSNERGSPDNVTCVVVDVVRAEPDAAALARAPPATESRADTAAPASAVDFLPDPNEPAPSQHTAERFNFKMVALERVPMFRHLTYQERVSFLSKADDRGYSAGEVLMEEGSAGEEFFVLVHGECTIRKGDQDVAVVGAGSPLGDMALIRRNPRTATVVARTDCRAIVVGREAFYSFLRSDAVAATKVLWAFSQVLTDRLATTTIDLEIARSSATHTQVDLPLFSLHDVDD